MKIEYFTPKCKANDNLTSKNKNHALINEKNLIW